MAVLFSRRLMVVLWLGLFSGAVHGELSSLYGPYQQLLEEHLREKTLENNGLISAFDYEAALADEHTPERLRSQRERLAQFDISDLEGKEESTAFWINAYNFFMLNQILTERPDGELVNSVWDYGGRYNPFVDNVFQREKFEIDDRQYSLDGIEKGILLGEEFASRGWKDARVHFAVNCAAVGCPPLRRSLYTAENLEQLLATNTRRAFSTARHLQIDGKTLRVTELFKWYEEDFTESAGSRKAFIRQWVDSSAADRVERTSEMTFIDYDWKLNRPENFPELR
jgi:hypothetical protein